MKIFEMYKMGGSGMNLISILAIVALVITILKVVQLIVKKTTDLKYLDFIRMSGSLALALGFLLQIIGITQALEAIREAADISPAIVMQGVLVSFYAPIWGMIVFIFSLLLWYVLKEVIRN